jgi:hypothetical protein
MANDPHTTQNPSTTPGPRAHTVSSFRRLIHDVQTPIREATLCPSQEPRLSITGMDIHPDILGTSVILLGLSF